MADVGRPSLGEMLEPVMRPQGGLPLGFMLESMGLSPRYSGGVQIPMLGGQLGVGGSYQPQRGYEPQDVGARVEYRRRF